MKKLLLIKCLLCVVVANAQYTKLHDFDSINGSHPVNDLILVGTTLYGMTVTGGISDSGTVFKINIDGSGYTKLFDFAGGGTGNWPEAGLFSDGTSLYGTTILGGQNNGGTIFKIHLDGSGYQKIYDFTNPTNGVLPECTFVSDNNFLYGTTNEGGIGNCINHTNGCGVVFKIKPDGTDYSKLFDFANNNVTGISPNSLFFDGIYLYGTTLGGGANNKGTIFKIKTDGTDFSVLYDFTGTPESATPFGNTLTSDGTSLYGMTYRGGVQDIGTIFRIQPDGSGYLKLLDFNGLPNGSSPEGTLVYDGNFLYGMTSTGGIYDKGVLFQLKRDGTNYLKLIDFAGSVNGSIPYGSLIFDGTHLYGMTAFGGPNDMGTIFKYQVNPTGISENKEIVNFTIYPNPSTGKLTIKTENLKIEKLEVYNFTGQRVFQIANPNHQATNEIDFSFLPKGVYLIRVYDNKMYYDKKIIIQ